MMPNKGPETERTNLVGRDGFDVGRPLGLGGGRERTFEDHGEAGLELLVEWSRTGERGERWLGRALRKRAEYGMMSFWKTFNK